MEPLPWEKCFCFESSILCICKHLVKNNHHNRATQSTIDFTKHGPWECLIVIGHNCIVTRHLKETKRRAAHQRVTSVRLPHSDWLVQLRFFFLISSEIHQLELINGSIPSRLEPLETPQCLTRLNNYPLSKTRKHKRTFLTRSN